ncbi:MAG: tetratricopeptide repeat protein, partial [bacterium]|nr:tetratricopeptide repeat protein [bacterium]
ILRSAELAELVGRLGRHPLSLRLAAVLLADGQSPREVLRDLRETGSLDETTDADDRLGSLRASLELSRVRLDAVAPGAAELWRIIAEFPAGIPEATELDGDDRRHLRVLLERHLLERRRGGIECLPPVRFFLRRHVEEPREERRTRIAAACGAALVKEIPQLADRFDQARVEDRIAFARWLTTIDVLLRAPAPPVPWRFLLLAAGASIASRTGLVPLAWRWSEAASWSDSPGILEALAHLQAGILAGHLGLLEDAHAHLTTALKVFQDHGKRVWEASTQAKLGELAQLRGRNEDAQAACRTALKIYRNLGNRLGEAQAHQFLGRVALVQERLDEVATHFDYALRLYDELGARLDKANLHKDLGDLKQRANRLSEARTQYDVALASFREIGHRLGEGETQKKLGDLAREEDRLDDARRHYEAAIGIFREIGYPFGEADTRGSLGNLARRQGQGDAARASYELAFQIYREIGVPVGEATAHNWLGELALDENRPRDARPHFEAALGVFRDLGRRSGEVWALHGLALAALREEEPQASLELAQQAADLALLIRHHLGAAASLSVAARSHLALDEPKNAVARLLGARYHARQAANRLEESKALRLLAGALLHAGPADPEQEAFARWVGIAGAVLAKRAAVPLPPELAQAVDELEASGQAAAVLDRVGRTLDDLTEESLPEPLRRSIQGHDPAGRRMQNSLGAIMPEADSPKAARSAEDLDSLTRRPRPRPQ